ncbi:MAG: glycosyltransferase family A protein [Dongiaceae bacterium]
MSGRRVSVVIAAYNLGRYVVETVESALAQADVEREVIVVDDGSTDDTPDRLAPYRDRIRLVRQDNAGLAAARNHALRLARGDYVALLDADDVWRPGKLAAQLAVAARRPRCGLIACDGYEFDGATVRRQGLFGDYVARFLATARDGEVGLWMHEPLIEEQAIGCPAQTLIPRPVIEELGPFADSNAQDYDYYLRIAQRYPMAFHADRLVGWRFRADSMSGPAWQRPLMWRLYRLPVLGAHGQRCADEADRRRVVRSIDRVLGEIAAMTSPAPAPPAE